MTSDTKKPRSVFAFLETPLARNAMHLIMIYVCLRLAWLELGPVWAGVTVLSTITVLLAGYCIDRARS